MTEERPAWRRRAARFVLLFGLALAAVYLLPRLPREQTLVFHVPENHVERLDVSYTPRGESEASGGFTLTFPDTTPRDVRHSVELPNGDYELSIELTPDQSGVARDRETRFERRVTLAGGETIISL